ncbi:MAG: hypothetical protein ACJ8DY_05710 [Xanthobacteraceae bacterium]
MQMKAPWFKPTFWGAVLGSVLTMIVGFGWGGWMLGSTGERMALDRTNSAMVVALTPSCVSKFLGQPNAAVKLKELQTTDTWRQREFVEAGGWATFAGDKSPNSNVASACAELLVKPKA